MMKHADNPEERPQPLFRGKFLELVKEGRWEYVRRVNANGAVMVIAVTEELSLIHI